MMEKLNWIRGRKSLRHSPQKYFEIVAVTRNSVEICWKRITEWEGKWNETEDFIN